MTTTLRERVIGAGDPPIPAPREPTATPEAVPVHVALARVMADVRSVAKGETHNSPGATFRYRGIDAVVNAVADPLRKHGVIVVPEVLDVSYRDVRTSKDKAAREVTVRVAYSFYGPDGGKPLRCVVAGEAMDSGDKGTAKAMSVAMRIALLQTLALPTDEPDPDSQAYDRVPEPPADPHVEARAAALDDLRVKAKGRGHDLTAVADVFERANGHKLGEAHPGAVAAFTASLLADPVKLGLPAPGGPDLREAKATVRQAKAIEREARES